jgi:hypothetical protein
MADDSTKLVLTRRALFAGAAGVALYSAVPNPRDNSDSESDSTSSPDAAVGRLRDIDRAAGTARLETGDTSVFLTLAPGAALSAGSTGLVEDLGGFVDGDRVAVEGTMGSSNFEAISINSSYEPFEATVDRREDSTVFAGDLAFDVQRMAQTHDGGRPDVRPGDVVQGLTWTNPVTGEVTVIIGSLPAASG